MRSVSYKRPSETSKPSQVPTSLTFKQTIQTSHNGLLGVSHLYQVLTTLPVSGRPVFIAIVVPVVAHVHSEYFVKRCIHFPGRMLILHPAAKVATVGATIGANVPRTLFNAALVTQGTS